MKSILRIVGVLGLLVAALAFYSMGMKTGAFFFILLGLICEAGFWLGLFPFKRKKTSSL
jgi:hypothetical protein